MNAQDALAIARIRRVFRHADHWGPYCMLPRHPLYVHVVCPVALGWIREDDGTTRPATDEELDIIERAYDLHLHESFDLVER